MKFVLHSHEIERVSLRRSHPHGLRARSDICAPFAQDYRFCDFQLEQTFQGTSEHGTRMKFRKENFFGNENRNELILE